MQDKSIIITTNPGHGIYILDDPDEALAQAIETIETMNAKGRDIRITLQTRDKAAVQALLDGILVQKDPTRFKEKEVAKASKEFSKLTATTKAKTPKGKNAEVPAAPSKIKSKALRSGNTEKIYSILENLSSKNAIIAKEVCRITGLSRNLVSEPLSRLTRQGRIFMAEGKKPYKYYGKKTIPGQTDKKDDGLDTFGYDLNAPFRKCRAQGNKMIKREDCRPVHGPKSECNRCGFYLVEKKRLYS